MSIPTPSAFQSAKTAILTRESRRENTSTPAQKLFRERYAEVMAEYGQIYSAVTSTIYSQITGLGLLPPARPIRKDPTLLDKQRYCEYHASVGHKMDECRDLVNTLIKACDDGGLIKFTNNESQDDGPRPDLIMPPPPGLNGEAI